MAIAEETGGIFLPRQIKWVMGVDLGQASDPTAISVIEHIRGVLDFNADWERHTGTGQIPQKLAERAYVRHLERLPLGMSYPAQVQEVKDRLARSPLNAGATLVLDATGVGKPVSDLFSETGLKHEAVLITAGSEVTRGKGVWHVAKSFLVSNLDAMLHTGTMKIAAELTEAGAMKDELKDFRRKLSDAGRATYAARTGAHDDLVLAVAIAAWWISRPPPPTPTFGVYSASAPRNWWEARK